MKLKELLEKIEELSKVTTGELTVDLTCDCSLDRDIDLKSQSCKPKINVRVIYPSDEVPAKT